MRAIVRAAVPVLVLIAAMPASAAAATCPSGRDGAGWTLSTTTFDNHYTRHAYVGNGYLSQRVPPAGTGYMATGEKTGWPLFTPRYDGAFVAGLYGLDPSIVDADGVARTIDAAIPTWSTLNVTVGSETYSSTTPAGRISNFRQELFLGCGLLRTSATWTTPDGRATDLVYDVLADRVDRRVGAVASDDDAALERPAPRSPTRSTAPARGGSLPTRQRPGRRAPGDDCGRLRHAGARHARHGRVDPHGAEQRRPTSRRSLSPAAQTLSATDALTLQRPQRSVATS